MARSYFLACLLLALLAGCSSQQSSKGPAPSPRQASTVQIEQNVTIVGNTVWKKSPNGLAIGISPAGDLAVNVHFENQGTGDIAGVILSSARFILELNGKYYATADFGGKSSFMSPGRTYGPLKVDLAKFWEIPKLTPHYTVEPNNSHPVLRKGKNVLRVHYKIENKLIPSGKLTMEK